MKNDLFNSTYEMELRIAALLCEGKESSFSVERILAIDFMVCYAKDFHFSDSNLHGDNSFMYSELSSRRALIQEAIKPLVYRGVIEAKIENGYSYKITENGIQYAQSFESEYARAYRSIAKELIVELGDFTDERLISLLHRKATEIGEGAN